MNLFACPLCKLPLAFDSSSLVCAQGHRFDRSKEGYFNLLPVQFKQSKNPGDSGDQLRARRQFLQAGYFNLLKEKLIEILKGSESHLDIGAGEGFFSQAIADEHKNAQVYGIDISKQGMKMAGKGASENAYFAVASSYDLPILSQSIQTITRIYAPSKIEEIARVLSPDGQFVVVTPGQKHLWALRNFIYDTVRDHDENIHFPGFQVIAQSKISEALQINSSSDVSALLTMTPFSWKLSPEKKGELLENAFRDTIDFNITVLRKMA